MKKTILFMCIMAVLILGACSPAAQATPAAPAQGSTAPSGEGTGAYPPAVDSPYPAMEGAGPVDNAGFTAYPPAESDAEMERDAFTVDKVELQANPDNEKLVDIRVMGSMPTSCNSPRVKVSPPDQENKINVEIYTVKAKGEACAQAIQPFDRVVASIGGYPAGKYTIVVNGKSVGDVTL